MPRKKTQTQIIDPTPNFDHLKIIVVNIDQLKGADYNPPHRTAPESGLFKRLVKSMGKFELFHPADIDPDYNVIDGHRRIAAAKVLNWKQFPCIIQTTAPPHTIFAEVNSSQYRLNGQQNLHVWLKNPKAVTEGTAKNFDRAAKRVGKSVLKKISNSGGSIDITNLSREVCRYVQIDPDEYEIQIINWLLKHRTAKLVRGWMISKNKPTVLWQRIKENKTIAQSF